MTETFCVKADVLLKAGKDVDVGGNLTDGNYTTFINLAESIINNQVKLDGVDLVDDFTNMDTNVKNILKDAASSHAAMAAIAYDMDGYTSNQAQTLLDYNKDRFEEAMRLLKDKNVINYLRGFNT